MTVLYFKRKDRRFPYHIVGKVTACQVYDHNNDVNVTSRCGSFQGNIYFGPFGGGYGTPNFTTYDEAPDNMVCLNCLKVKITTDNTTNKEQ